MSNELNILKEEATGISAEVSPGGDKGGMDENKIVSINKSNPAESENTDAQPSAESSAAGTPPDHSTAGTKLSSCAEEKEAFSFGDEERPRNRLFRFRSANEEESRDKLILSRIRDEDLMEYLALEQRRLEFLQQSREAKGKRLLIAFELLISLAAIVAITYLLQDNPTILISILYITGIVAAFYAWKNPRDKRK